MNDLKKPISQKFSHAAPRYDYNALVQQQIIDKLVRRLQHVALPFEPRILEIGCGTGVLSRRLQQLWPHAEFVLSDLSENMVRQARSSIPPRSPKTDYLVMDAAYPAFAPKFDLIVSSMILHWLPQPQAGIRKLISMLPPGGILAFTILERDSFVIWRQACAAAGVDCGLWHYPTLEEIKSISGIMAIKETIQTFFDSSEDFLKNLKSIGSGTPRPNYKPLNVTDMKKALVTANQRKPFLVNYEVIFAAYHATSGIADRPNTLSDSEIAS